MKNKIFLLELKLIKKLPSPIKTILDVGCGNGEWVDFLNKNGYIAEGIDKLLNTSFEDIPIKKYDLITFRESVYYFNPQFLLNKLSLMTQNIYIKSTLPTSLWFKRCSIVETFKHAKFYPYKEMLLNIFRDYKLTIKYSPTYIIPDLTHNRNWMLFQLSKPLMPLARLMNWDSGIFILGTTYYVNPYSKNEIVVETKG